MGENKWRFPGNNYTADNGLDTADMETFKKDSISSLARELCQNSVDAKRKDKSQVRIEFKTFEIKREDIPNVDEIASQLEACKQTWPCHKTITPQLESMLEQINKPTITCLRVSDFNTTGLIGINDDSDDSPWHNLVHGSGISNKVATSGGSKGIGKFATFVNSYFNTVFYSSKTEKGEMGYEGICKLCSAKMPNTDEKTQGIGYFGSTDKNEPVLNEQLQLDKSFSRENEYGTDVFILGFKKTDGWKRDIVSMILESFMSAIVFDSLRITVDDIELTADKLSEVVFNEKAINKKDRKSIISQYLLLSDKEHIFEDKITIDGYGDAILYLKIFDKEQEEFATNGCVMIRYPYMKIKDIKKITSLPCSAMCIIGDNKLNETLRNVENPQHTDWEFKRIDDPDTREEIKAIYAELVNQIKKNLQEHLTSSDNTQTDVEGAGNYLPGVTGNLGDNKQKEQKIQDKATIQKKKVKPKTTNINASIEDKNGDGVELDIGETTDEGDDALAPDGYNQGKLGSVRPGPNPAGGKTGDGGNVIVKQATLRGMNYRFFCINKKERKYGVVFKSDFNVKDAYFTIAALDDSGNKMPIVIEKCMINGTETELDASNNVKFELVNGQTYKLELTTDQEELFSGEVKIYEYR